MGKIESGYGVGAPLQNIFPQPVVAKRAPTTADKRYPKGQLWINEDSDQAWFLTSVSAGSAVWAISSPGASDVDTLTGDSGGALSPAAGNITLAGGTNITSAGAGSTITFNLDAAITLATSVTSALYTTAAASDLLLTAAAGQDVVIKMGDAAAANKVSFTDNADVEVAAIDSNGGLTTTALTFTGLLTAAASATINTAGTALNLGTDNSADAVNIGNGTAARTISIGTEAATAHIVNIGNAAAGALSLDSAAAISLDGGAASNFSVSGAGIDLTLASAAGRVVLNGEEAAANAITLLSAAGGLDADVALQMNLASSQNAADAVVISASAGGIDVTAAGAAGEDLDLSCTSGSVNVVAGEAIADSVKIESTAGGVDILASGAGAGLDIDIVNTGGSVNISATESAADAVKLEATLGGIDILASGAAAGEDIDIVATGSSVNVESTEADANAIVLNASNAAGGMALSSGSAGLLVDTSGVLELNSSAGVIGIGNDAVAQNINIGTGAAARTVTVGNATGASALVLQSGTGDITLTGTVKEVNAEFSAASGDDITFQDAPLVLLSGNAPALPTGATGTVNLMSFRDFAMEQFILGAGQTIIAPVMDATGLLVSGDLTATEGFEYNWGAARSNSRHAFTIGTSAAFFLEWKFTVADVSGAAPYMIGFRKAEANNATLTSYTDYAMIGLDAVAAVGNVVLKTELNAGGTTNTDTTDAWNDAESHTLKVLVSAAGVVTYEIDGGAPSVTAAFTFDNADVVVPFMRLEHQAGAPGAVHWETVKVGFQA